MSFLLAFFNKVNSYLMGVDAIDQTICPEVLGMTNSANYWSLPAPKNK
jgi:hypothetical protein